MGMPPERDAFSLYSFVLTFNFERRHRGRLDPKKKKAVKREREVQTVDGKKKRAIELNATRKYEVLLTASKDTVGGRMKGKRVFH